RGLTSSDDAREGHARALISDSPWARRIGGGADVVGRGITVDNRPLEVAGVLPAAFRFTNYARDTEIWLPLSQDPFTDRRYARGVRSLGVVARLVDGVSIQQAQTDLERVAATLRAYPAGDPRVGLR